VLMLTQTDTGSYLLQLRNGVEDAASELGARLTVATFSGDALSQLTALKENGISAVLFYPTDDTALPSVKAACEALSLPLTLLGRAADGFAYAASGEREAGALAAQEARRLGGGQAVVLDGSGRRLEGAKEAGGSIVLESGEPGTWSQAAHRLLSEGACVAALTEEATLAAAEWKQSGLLTCAIVGMDPGPERAALLENGTLAAEVLPVPYAIGYAGMKAACQPETAVSRQTLAPRLITLETLYDARNVKLSFPLIP
ncbi:MAG: substrate-binding domain-containing protein, partial [Eubacteriales bacterium]|nr:substrate-binding domain-containing protein [Eubacteriales bacterium]